MTKLEYVDGFGLICKKKDKLFLFHFIGLCIPL